jgi:hypothetical protein
VDIRQYLTPAVLQVDRTPYDKLKGRMRLATTIGACVVFATASLAGDHSERALSSEIEGYVNVLIDYSRTICTTRSALSGKGRAVSLATAQPMLETQTTRKAFLAASIGAVGKVTRDNSWFECREVLLTDMDAANRGVFYKLPCSTVKDLQRRMHDEDMPLEDALATAETSLREVSIEKAPSKRAPQHPRP